MILSLPLTYGKCLLFKIKKIHYPTIKHTSFVEIIQKEMYKDKLSVNFISRYSGISNNA